MVKKSSTIVRVVILLCTAWVLAACSLLGEAATGVSPELEMFIAQAIVDEQANSGYRYPEGAIIAHVVSTDPTGEPVPMRVWRYSQGQLTEEKLEALAQALGDNRAEWPSFTFVFKFGTVTSQHATVEIETYYNMGIAPTSRGGHAERWELEKQGKEWVVAKTDTYMFWD